MRDDQRIELTFPYFLERAAPAGGARASWTTTASSPRQTPNKRTSYLAFGSLITSLCPCRKAISDYGHNQRGYVTVEVRGARPEGGPPAFIWIEELIDLAEGARPPLPCIRSSSGRIERHVTMQAYDNYPAFVEDIVRNVAGELRDDPRVAWFRVHVVNQKSIHNHSRSPGSSRPGLPHACPDADPHADPLSARRDLFPARALPPDRLRRTAQLTNLRRRPSRNCTGR